MLMVEKGSRFKMVVVGLTGFADGLDAGVGGVVRQRKRTPG